MSVQRSLALALALCLALGSVAAKCPPPRSKWQRTLFVRAHACPATGEHRLPCPGYVIDHVIALCVGGADLASNMQWQTIEAARAKDRWECKKPA